MRSMVVSDAMRVRKVRVHTAYVPPEDRVDVWRAWVSAALYPIYVHPLGSNPPPFMADFRGARGRQSLAMAGTITPARSVVSRSDAACADARRVQVFLPLVGGGVHSDDHGAVVIRPGAVVVMAADRARAYVRTAVSESVMIEVDTCQLSLSRSQVRKMLFQPLPVPRMMLRLMRDSVTNILAAGSADAEAADTFLAGTVDLVLRSALGLDLDHSGTGFTRIEQIRRHCEKHLSDPVLSPESIAAALRMSRRTIYNVFHDTDSSPMALITELRVNRAGRLLSQQSPPLSLAEIAEACGFTGTDHLYRVFRRVTGEPPAAYREARRQQNGPPPEMRAPGPSLGAFTGPAR